MLSDFRYRLRSIFRRKAVEQELEEELNFHLEQQAAKYARNGESAEEAERKARLAVEGPEQVKERCRDVRGTLLWDTTLQDLRYAIRQLRGAPGFAVIAVLILALGIGANTAIFNLLDAVVLQALPVRNPQQLYVPRWTAKESPHPYHLDEYDSCFGNKVPGGAGACTFPYPIFKLFASQHEIFSSVTAFAGPIQLNAMGDGAAAVVNGELVSGSFFQTLGVRPVLGRTFHERDDTPTATATVVLSYAYWQSAFGGDHSVLRKTIRLDGRPFTVIGVAEPGFNRLSPGRVCDLWMPIHTCAGIGISWLSLALEDEHHFWLEIIARSKPGVTRAHMDAALTAAFRNRMVHGSKVLKPDSDASVEVAPANKALAGIREMLEKPLYVLMCGVGLLLLIACTNVAGLVTARAAARQREIAIRLAVGAGRTRIVRQLLTESILIAALGGFTGIAVAWCVTRSLTSFLPFPLDVSLDSRILLFTTGVSIASGILFGILPAVRGVRAPSSSTSAGLQHAMSSAARRKWFSNSLVVAQMGLAVIMLVGAGLFVRTLLNLRNINPGFNASNLLMFQLDPISLHYAEPRIRNLYRTLHERLGSVPGITGVTYSSMPLVGGGTSSTGYQIEGRADRHSVRVRILDVGPDFFQTIGIPLLAGRVFTASDFANARPLALVNQAFVKEYCEGHNPLGLHFYEDSPNSVHHEIIGVSRNAKYNDLRDDIPPVAYLPLANASANFELRTAVDPSSIIPAVRKIVREVDPNLPLFEVRTQTEQIDQLLLVERLVARLSIGFGLLALTLACTGLFGLLSYEVTRRTREIGIRMAIGAAPGMVRRGILRETLVLVLAGLALGIPAALTVTHSLSAMLYGVQPDDALNVAFIASILLIVAAVAGYIPASRASRVDPTIALRYE